jgi:hypothetical protein
MLHRSNRRHRGSGRFSPQELMFAFSVLFLAWIIVTG